MQLDIARQVAKVIACILHDINAHRNQPVWYLGDLCKSTWHNNWQTIKNVYELEFDHHQRKPM